MNGLRVEGDAAPPIASDEERSECTCDAALRRSRRGVGNLIKLIDAEGTSGSGPPVCALRGRTTSCDALIVGNALIEDEVDSVGQP